MASKASMIYWLWQHTLSGPMFMRFNRLLFNLSIRGLGILNYKTSYLSGEDGWLGRYLAERRDPVVFDVGGNLGRYTENLLRKNPGCTVHVFEPHPENFVRLERHCGANSAVASRTHMNNCALGDVRGTMELYDYGHKDGSSHASLYREVIEDIHRAESVCHNVDVITLDAYCEARGIDHIDLLKIDTEGYELKCLQGAGNLLDLGAIDAILFEFNEMNIISGATFKDFWQLLQGFSIARLLPGGRLLPIEEYSPLTCELYAYQNIVAVRD